MNLDDFSYEENGRRYIDPNVSLNEQNAFIQNLRDTQAQRNDQIAQQTHNLGTDVPSTLGGLNGSEAYFNSRYQTPQTNSLVGNLKAAAQAQALSTALNNELQKAQKRYNDAYYAARAKAASSSGGTTDNKDQNGLPVSTDTDEGSGEVDQQQVKSGHLYTENGNTYLYNEDGSSTQVRTPNAAETTRNQFRFSQTPKNGTTFTDNGTTYIYIDNGDQQPAWFAIVGTK